MLLFDIHFIGHIAFDWSNTTNLGPISVEDAMERKRTDPWWILAETGDKRKYRLRKYNGIPKIIPRHTEEAVVDLIKKWTFNFLGAKYIFHGDWSCPFGRSIDTHQSVFKTFHTSVIPLAQVLSTGDSAQKMEPRGYMGPRTIFEKRHKPGRGARKLAPHHSWTRSAHTQRPFALLVVQ